MLTIYTIKSKNSDNIWEFKYNLNGNLKTFNILEGVLTTKQMIWFFREGNFPVIESIIKTIWIPNLKQNFEITVGEISQSFDNLWDMYNYKVGKRKMAENIWKRMSAADKIKVFINISKYKNYLKYFPNQQMMYLTTYLNQEAYKNDWKI